MSDLGTIGLSFHDPAGIGGAALCTQSLSISNTQAGGSGAGGGITTTQPVISILYVGLPGAAQAQGDGVRRVVSGNVQEIGSNLSGCTVRCYRDSDGAFLGEAVTDASGNFSIPIYGDTTPVSVIVLDKAGGVNYNAIVKSQIIPV